MSRVNQIIKTDFAAPGSVTYDAVTDRRWRIRQVITEGGSDVTIVSGATTLVDITTGTATDHLPFPGDGLQCGPNEDVVITSTGTLTVIASCE